MIRCLRSRTAETVRACPPTVLIDRGADAPGFDTVRADCVAGGYAAARHLIDLGHRDIAVLTHSKRLDNIEQRIAGCRRALSEAGSTGATASSTAAMISKACAARSNSSSTAPIGRPRFSPSPTFAPWPRSRPRAVSASKSPATCRLSASTISTGCRRCSPYLTTVAQPVDDFASTAWRLLMRRLKGEVESDVERIELPCTLKVREFDRARPPAAQGRRGGPMNTKTSRE